ncbi:cationic amino acid transporter 4 isoform X2 [Herpailurus yagouaroundi]|uniref:Cationic amino acid transporter 4 isoform X2 n=1 Tax=Acinonyx jubatus TaxID=32536 RepID=A0A6J1YL82_ACIJB|nr:cationic amino acid transporter 4 isoform X2 [Acinonyx jubatus]XP_040322924.1 cationic amino acid transporter 4 isoform X2 [Puma yagouaroundi]
MLRGLPSTASLARFCQKLNRLKPLEESTMETSLRRCLSTLDLTLLGVGGMVGSGLYVLTGTVAKQMAGPAVLLSFAVAAVASLLSALCYAEFGARLPRTGSAYLFTYVSMGELWAFLIGWNVLLEYLIGGAAVARAWSGYLDAMFNHRIHNFTEAYVGTWQVPLLAHYPDFLAAGIIILASVFISCGARVSSWLNHTFSVVSLVIILFIIILGFILARPHNWSAEEGGFAPFGFSGIMAGTATCFYAFVGFDVIAASSEEARNPKQAVPVAITISLGLAAGAYILVSTVLTLMVPWHSLDPDSALADAFYRRGYSWAGFIVAAGSICAMNTVLLSSLFSLPRIVYAMAVDGLFFQVFAQVHPRTQVPMAGILVFGGLMTCLALLLDLEALVQFLSIGTLLAYTFVATSIIVLRFQRTPPSSSSGPASPDPSVKEYHSFSDHIQLVGTEQDLAPEPGQLRPALRPYLGFLDPHGAPDSSPEYPPQHLPHAEAKLPDLAALLHLAADRARRVFWLWHLAQQRESAGVARADHHTLRGVPQHQPGGDGTDCAAPQPAALPGAQPHGVAHQSVNRAGGPPMLALPSPHLLRSPEELGVPSV